MVSSCDETPPTPVGLLGTSAQCSGANPQLVDTPGRSSEFTSGSSEYTGLQVAASGGTRGGTCIGVTSSAVAESQVYEEPPDLGWNSGRIPYWTPPGKRVRNTKI